VKRIQGAAAMLLALAWAACNKVPLHDVQAGFALADASWFEEEETLFIFYEVHAQQGLGDPSVVEITYATDDERVPWTPVSELPTVHRHLPVDCGTQALCGSTSLHVALEPREVEIRLRYHKDGELALDADSVFNVVQTGAPHSHRSMLVYGVFDATNQYIQWRGRHLFPTLRNQRATELGLRRDIIIEDQRYGTVTLAAEGNPYGYGFRCPADFTDAALDRLKTDDRAAFHPDALPQAAARFSAVCADATVTDATGPFTVDAFARKNPEVRAAFPVLRSPVRDATPLHFFLGPCDRNISRDHEDMQRQRLLLGNERTTCIDDWQDDGFEDGLAALFSDAVEDARPAGNDMVLVVALHREDAGAAAAVERALSQVVPEERHRSSPRLAGAFVFDSDIRGLSDPYLEPSTLWCPATLPTGEGGIPGASSLTCAILPDNPDFELGPFTFETLPVLPSRSMYLDFIEAYSKSQAGEVQELRYRTPEFATTSDHVDLDEYGVVTFLNDEIISADYDDAFSYCPDGDPQRVVFRSEGMQSEEVLAIIAQQCRDGELPQSFCATATQGLLPLNYLPEWHDVFGEETYELGIYWDFPFLLRMKYEVVSAGNVSAFGLSVPFGVANNGRSFLGTALWTNDELPLDERLKQCRRFCDHPTFDSAGVYHIQAPFRTAYASSCYLPAFPAPGDGGFPLDP
jgi:hypothetical protein